MCTWLTALAVLRYAPDYGDFGAINGDIPGMRFASSGLRLLSAAILGFQLDIPDELQAYFKGYAIQ